MTQKLDLFVTEMTLVFIYGHPNFDQGFKNQLNVKDVFVGRLREDDNIVDVCKGEVPAIVRQDCIHRSLEVCRRVLKPEWYSLEFVETIFCNERCKLSAIEG